MAKKINPKEQTEELNRAHFEFLKRSPELEEFLKLADQNENRMDEYATQMATFSGKCHQELKEEWKTIASEAFFDEYYKTKIFERVTFPAANECWFAAGFLAYIDDQILLHGLENLPYMIFDEAKRGYFMTKDVMNEEMLDYLCRNARQIFTELTNAQPVRHLLVGIDLLRSKDVICAEVSELITHYQDLTGTEFEHTPRKRFKWLPIVDDFLAVWDAWIESGEPARQSFPAIAKRLNVPESTVKARWYKAYGFIYKKKYETDPVKRREQRTDRALELLCLKCTNPVCGNKHGGEEIGCPAYVKMAGENTPRERGHENFDSLADMQALESYLETEQE